MHGYTRLGSVIANDYDPDGDPFAANPVTQPAHGRLFGTEITSTFDYSPEYGYVGVDSFTYVACDSACSSPATVTITVNNNPPVAASDSYTVHGYTRIGPVQGNDTDPDGDQVLFDGVLTFPTHGSLFGTATSGVFDYSPSYGYVGSDSFTYRVCDNLGACSTTTVSINAVNQAPVAASDSYTVHGYTGIGPVQANDTDPDGDQVLFDGVLTLPTHGLIIWYGNVRSLRLLATARLRWQRLLHLQSVR